MFLGQSTRKRPINLGNKQQLSRNDLLKRAQDQRESRQDTRRRHDAAATIQRAFRHLVKVLAKKKQLLAALESHPPLDKCIFLANFISCIAVLDSAHQPETLIQTALAALDSSFLHKQLILAMNRLWAIDSPLLHSLQAFYGCDLPDGIIEPLHRYATKHNKHQELLRGIFNRLVALYPQQVIKCALESDTLMNLGVSLIITGVDISSTETPEARLLYLLKCSLANPEATSFIVTLVSALTSLKDPQILEFVNEPPFLRRVEALKLEPKLMARFLLPLVHSSARTRLLPRLFLSDTNFVQLFWHAFTQTATFDSIERSDLSGSSSDWCLLVVLLEMYSYHMVICNDASLFDVLPSDQVVTLAITLRSICFRKSWAGWKLDLPASNEIFFTVTRQLYTRDSRRQFLPTNFWLVQRHIPIAKFKELDEMLRQLTHDHQQFSEYDDDDDDDDDNNSELVQVKLPPSVEILKETPFFIDFLTRVSLFRQFIPQNKPVWRTNVTRQVFPINRESLPTDVESAFNELAQDGGIKTGFRVQILSGGEPEVGIDGGGLTKEVLSALCLQVFVTKTSPEYSDLFAESFDHTLYPNPKYGSPRHQTEEVAQKYRFLGMVIGKCLYENLLVEVVFSPLFLHKWAGINAKSSFDDFYLLDPELYNNLIKLLKYSGNVEDLALDFTTEDFSGQPVLLKPGGDSIPVTNQLRLEYLHALAHYKLNAQLSWQTRHFLEGIAYFISPSWLKMFNTHEIQMLISGQNSDFNTDDLRLHSVVNGFAQDVYVEYFWQVVDEMTAQERRALLKFVTSVPRGPLEGFGHLNPKFGIRSAGRTDERLPTASTCVNLLKLPEYSSKQVLREKLLYSINSNAGFDLS